MTVVAACRSPGEGSRKLAGTPQVRLNEVVENDLFELWRFDVVEAVPRFVVGEECDKRIVGRNNRRYRPGRFQRFRCADLMNGFQKGGELVVCGGNLIVEE